jgi:hypothetical protein
MKRKLRCNVHSLLLHSQLHGLPHSPNHDAVAYNAGNQWIF